MTEKYLLLHPKGMDPSSLQAFKRQAAALLDGEVVLSVEDYAQYNQGSWRDWIDNVCPRYDGVVSLTTTIGKANAQILQNAFDTGLTVALCSMAEGKIVDLLPACQVVTDDEKNWKTGWHLE